MDEALVTGPKINPEREQHEAFQRFFEKHRKTDVALALLDTEMPSLVLSSNLNHAVAMHGDGMPLEQAITKECEEIYARYISGFSALPNKHRISEVFIEKLLKKKIEFDWSRVEFYDYKYAKGAEGDATSRKYLGRFLALFVTMLDADRAHISEQHILAEFIKKEEK